MYLFDVPCEALLVYLTVARFPQAYNVFLIWTVSPVSPMNTTHFLLRVKCLLNIQLKITVSWWHTNCWMWKLRIRSIPVVLSESMLGDRVLVLRFAWESDTREIWNRRSHFRLPVFRLCHEPEDLKHTYQSIEEPAWFSSEYMIDSTPRVFTAPQGHLWETWNDVVCCRMMILITTFVPTSSLDHSLLVSWVTCVPSPMAKSYCPFSVYRLWIWASIELHLNRTLSVSVNC
jgi:hypothetical protein